MEFINQFFDQAQSLAGYVVPFLFSITIIIFFHELGHFMVARWCGVTVEVFSIGFGREIFGFVDKHGTRWKFSWIPLGGYVKFLGDDSVASTPDNEGLDKMDASQKAGSFHHKSLAKRAAVVAAGPIANFLLAIVIFAGVLFVMGERSIPPLVNKVTVGSAAQAAGLQPGDLIKQIDGIKIETFAALQRIVSENADNKLTLIVERGDKKFPVIVTPILVEFKDKLGNVQRVGRLGVTGLATKGNVVEKSFGPIEALGKGVDQTWFVTTRTLGYLYNMVLGREDASQLGGPARIAHLSGQIAKIGFAALLNLIAVLSVSIGLLNLFPIPMLDGGHLMFYGIEAVRGKPLSERAQDYGFRFGLALVIMLMVFATWNDALYFKEILKL